MLERARHQIDTLLHPPHRRRALESLPQQGALSSEAASLLTETILDFTQSRDKYIPIFAQAFHAALPDVSVHYPDRKASHFIYQRVRRRIDKQAHTPMPNTDLRGYAKTNLGSVAEVLNDEVDVSKFTGNVLYAAIVGILVENDKNYLNGRPGNEKTPRHQFKSCAYIFESAAARKQTVIPPLNAVFTKTAEYMQTVTREQFLADYATAGALRIPHDTNSLSEARNILGDIQLVIARNNTVLGKKVLLPPCVNAR